MSTDEDDGLEPIDYVTCDRCRAMRAVYIRACPRCARLDAVRVERFGALVTSRAERKRERERKGRGKLL